MNVSLFVAACEEVPMGAFDTLTQTKWCDCCKTKRATNGRVATGAGFLLTGMKRIDLCKACADAKHECSMCIMCGLENDVWVWQCRQVHHLGEVHPGVIERRLRAPDDKPVLANDNLKLLGTIDLDALERLHEAEK